MKVEKIIIENINSIENAEISFSEGVLAAEPLFLITGETGSGKSTILDAITLALYDKSPRYENTKNKEKTENGITNMQSTTNVLRKGTNDGKAELWFAIGNEHYIATWQMHRTRNGKYDMTNRRKLEVTKGDERIVIETKIDAVNQQITELVGLTYDQFVRSVMLAQGQFNTFLTSEKAKQTEILEMLTGTEIYSKIAEIVGRKKNDAKNDVDKANELYNSLNKNILSADEMALLNDELAKNRELLNKNELETKKLEQDLRNLENLERLRLEIDEYKLQLADLQASYKKMLEEKSTLMSKAEELGRKIDDQSENKSMYEQITLIVNILQDAEKGEKKIDEYKKEKVALQNQRTLVESEGLQIDGQLKDAEKILRDTISDYEKFNAKFVEANLNRLISDYNAHKTELANQEGRKTKYLRVKQLLEDYINKKQVIENKSNELINLKNHFNIVEQDYLAKKSVYEAKDLEYQAQKNMVGEYMKSLRSKLEDGKPCPLCGSTSHQYHDERVVDSLFASIEKSWNEAKNDFEQSKDAKNKSEGEQRLISQSIDNEQNMLMKINAELTKECNGKPIYDMVILEKGLKDCDSKILAVDALIKEINSKIVEAQGIQNQVQTLLKIKNEAEKSFKAIENKANTLKNEIADIDGKIKNRDELVSQISKDVFEKINHANALIVIEKWEEQWRKSSAGFYQMLYRLSDEWKRLNDEFTNIGAEIAGIDDISKGIKRIEGIDRVEEFGGKIAIRDNIDKNNLISGFSKVVFNLIEKDEQAKLIENQIGDDSVENSMAKTLRELTELRELKTAQTATIAELHTKLSINAQNTASAQAAKDDLQAMTNKLSLWTQLANAIGTTATDNFRDVAQAYTMRILLDQANYFLRKLSQRYELTCYSNSLAIMVMDKEMGGELRSASSLSGGETFLVSLALALGLAALNDENLNVDMLFIDEGFGTLDGESLEMAVQALGNMKKFGKKVGIISHVDSLKERIPAQIIVTKRGKASSSVEIKKS